MSRYEKGKMLLLGLAAGVVLAGVMAERPVWAEDRSQLGRYQIVTSAVLDPEHPERGPLERTYVLDTATGQVKRIHAPHSSPAQIVVLGSQDIY